MDDENLESYCKDMFRLELSILTAGSIIDKLEKEYVKYHKIEPEKIDEPMPQKPEIPSRDPYPEEPKKEETNKHFFKRDKNDPPEKKEYDAKCKKIDEEYQKKLNEYNDSLEKYNSYQERLNKNKADADEKTYYNLKVAKPVIISKIKLMTKCIERSRKTLDLLYQSKKVDAQYHGIVPAFVFCNYLKNGRFNSFNGDDGLVAAYKKDYEDNLIPMYTDIPNVKSAKQDVIELVNDVISTLSHMKVIDYDVYFKINAYAAELNEFAENITKEHNLLEVI